MIVVVRQQAQISNRLVSLSALMAHCQRQHIGLLIFSLGDYRDQFEAAPSGPGVRIIFLPRLQHRLLARVSQSRLLQALCRLPGLHALSAQRPWSMIEPARLRSGLWLINGSGDWCTAMPAIRPSEATEIRRLLAYRSAWQQQAAALSSQLRSGCDVLVGIHARRGDYASHRGGRWFYDEADYLRWISQVPALFASMAPTRIRVVICSNERGFLTSAQSAAITLSPLQSAAGDQLLLSHCDLIIGPPSTFSVWAAFLTDTRLLHIFQRDQQLDPSQIRRSTLFYDWRPNREAQA